MHDTAQPATPEERRTAREIAARRTFAIISHPDAGKTTLTEKLLLYGGAIQMAGSVKARRAARHATSDWMEMERQRGISVTTSVMQFTYGEHCVNILDTPGHQDFSEDTYRTLAAADAAVMLIDAAKGVEPQTEKLFRVCQLRKLPVFTFVNKMDRHGREPLDLMSEIEEHLGMPAYASNWPVFEGPEFRGVYDRETEEIHLFQAARHGQTAIEAQVLRRDDPALSEHLSPAALARLDEDIELLDVAGDDTSPERVLAGALTPMFFGSALTNFGVELLLQRFLAAAPAPTPRRTVQGETVPVTAPFSGFVFKMQANMDASHRDRVAFLRVCSGHFHKGMKATLTRTGKVLSLKNPTAFMARERTVVEEAYAGDIVGLYDPGVLRIGDTLAVDGRVEYEGIPHFSPEHFRRVRVKDPLKRKQLAKGLAQLTEEGAIQVFADDFTEQQDIVGAVGVLQFDVLAHRLSHEYRVDVVLEPMPYKVCRWVVGDGFDRKTFRKAPSSLLVRDRDGHPVVLFPTEWGPNWVADKNPGLELLPVSPIAAHAGRLS